MIINQSAFDVDYFIKYYKFLFPIFCNFVNLNLNFTRIPGHISFVIIYFLN